MTYILTKSNVIDIKIQEKIVLSFNIGLFLLDISVSPELLSFRFLA